jgi:WD40 repeat protein
MKRERAPADSATLFVTHAHRDISPEMMRSYIEVGDGCYWTIHAIAWSPDGRYWASAGADDTLRIWDASAAHELAMIYPWNRLRGKVLDLVWSPDGRYIGVLADGGAGHHESAESAHEVSVLNVLTGEEVYRAAGCVGNELAWSMNQPRDPNSTHSVAIFAHDPARTWSPDGRFFLASDDEGSGDPHDQERTATFSLPDVPAAEWSAAGSCNGRRMSSGTVRVIDRESGRVKVLLARGTSLAAWSPASNHIASVRRNTIALWDVEWGTLRCAYRGHTGWWSHVTCLSWAPSGRQIASGDSSGAIHIWRVHEHDDQ